MDIIRSVSSLERAKEGLFRPKGISIVTYTSHMLSADLGTITYLRFFETKI